MKAKVLFSSATLAGLAMALTPTTAAADAQLCFMEYQMAMDQCNGDQVCAWFAYDSYEQCLRDDGPPGDSDGPGGGY